MGRIWPRRRLYYGFTSGWTVDHGAETQDTLSQLTQDARHPIQCKLQFTPYRWAVWCARECDVFWQTWGVLGHLVPCLMHAHWAAGMSEERSCQRLQSWGTRTAPLGRSAWSVRPHAARTGEPIDGPSTAYTSVSLAHIGVRKRTQARRHGRHCGWRCRWACPR